MIQFVGRDGPDFGFCSQELPLLEPGQVLLLQLRSRVKASFEHWQLVGADGYGMMTRVAETMGNRLQPVVIRAFIIRELVNYSRTAFLEMKLC